ncbi:NAD(P)/FAD-dependent oxidoreductase [Amycolatopsis sp. AA4]|uniref:bifunctional NAD(P)/FAD-dependent oxidoreductase/class I SAM-dependent methyltransferase n=1 Tax=Actinomycetes TaxID=1760 RepID=UPI0001B55A71|nr:MULTISPECIES: bifunctional NAD(P)/FAD-dependent oxidoreductase/class I SAM-dependent methyltransferase [Actinomycetes]ATY10155.1 NAD(P)/FAD-dependent oxidoreductase [Amycolatopsis sp. AA4]EFL05604.1 thioredoxin-disulfide reductase [Streptomyces sp. AA4]
MDEKYDVVVVGGGAAGLSGAVALARSRRSVLVVDSGEPRNAPAGHVHNYLGRESTPPAELLSLGRAELAGYGGEVVSQTVTSIAKQDNGFEISLADGRRTRARRVLVATGLVDELPEVAGLAARWGRDVLHCPYCHGWEVRDRAVGVLSTGPMTVHQALMWRQLTGDVVVFRHTHGDFDEAPLRARGIRIVDGVVAAVETEGDRLTGVRLESGEVVAREALAVAAPARTRADFLAPLGIVPEPVEFNGFVIGTRVPADAAGRTAVPGLWAAGNVTDMRAQVVVSAAAGLTAGAAINGELVEEEAAEAVRQREMPFSHEMEREVARANERHADTPPFDRASWEERYRSRDEMWSGRPNDQLVTEARDLEPGHALDAGCGEGGDALWLAQQGWRVTAVDFSTTAIERGRAQAAKLGLADRITWVAADLAEWLPESKFDLVTTHFLHVPSAARTAAFARLADAVAPGGTLLVVGHDPADHHAGRPHLPDMMFTAEEVAETLDQSWASVTAEVRERAAVGAETVVRDTVLVARKG